MATRTVRGSQTPRSKPGATLGEAAGLASRTELVQIEKILADTRKEADAALLDIARLEEKKAALEGEILLLKKQLLETRNSERDAIREAVVAKSEAVRSGRELDAFRSEKEGSEERLTKMRQKHEREWRAWQDERVQLHAEIKTLRDALPLTKVGSTLEVRPDA